MLGLVPAFEAKDLPVGQSDRSVGIITVHVAGKGSAEFAQAKARAWMAFACGVGDNLGGTFGSRCRFAVRGQS
ncbi:hypothetical protein A9Z06_00340 [Rhizobium sp. YK2]|nr:hypothetical protein A9Z06_00340 [Rhizobium sp. YK2]